MSEQYPENQPSNKQPGSMSIDLNLFPLSRQNIQNLAGFPGLYMVTPPRKTARGRERDRLILYFTLTGNAPLTEAQQEQLLARLAQTYYKSPGSITSAQRKIADTLNQYLLDRNLRSSNSGRQGIGIFQVVVLRDDTLTIGHCGPAHAFLINPAEAQHLHDPQTAGRGLGLARSVSMRFFQFRLQNNDLIILSPQPPGVWTSAALQNAHKQGIESLRRRLISQAGNDLNAILIQALLGTGKLRMMRPKPASPMVQAAAGSGLPASPDPEAEMETPSKADADLSSSAETGTTIEPAGNENVSDPIQESDQSLPETGPLFPLHYQMPTAAPPQAEPGGDDDEPQATPAQTPNEQLVEDPPFPAVEAPVQTSVEGGEATPKTPTETPRRAKVRWLGKKKSPTENSTAENAPVTNGVDQQAKIALPRKAISLAAAFLLSIWQRISIALRGFLKRVLPDENLFTIPASTMMFVAVAVGVVFATTGGMMYFQRGRSAQYQHFYDQALAAAQQATTQNDPVEIRTDWEISLHFVNQAESFMVTTETETLRAHARQALDNMDAIQRINFQNAIVGGLAGSAQITRMFATDTDLYLLDASNGNVIRAVLTGKGYERDPNFSCSPTSMVGPLVDITPLPKGNNLKATVLGMDASANLLYCIPGQLPVANSPAPPQTNWREPIRFTTDAGNLYVLDPPANAVWIYRGIDVNQEPRLFFGSQIPFMPDVIDLAVNRNDLYLLHTDGHITTCTYSSLQESPTRCQDPTPYYDSRIGRQSGAIIPDAPFTQIQYTSPPDPSIYMLDPLNQAIYHFSLRLTFQRQFRSLTDLGTGEATAFTISSNRLIFLAIGNRVYYADLP
ncbi:MAG: hypothetical protein R6V73_09700 [Anaerolineales bacterium]